MDKDTDVKFFLATVVDLSFLNVFSTVEIIKNRGFVLVSPLTECLNLIPE